MRQHRIKKGVSPHGGKRLIEVSATDTAVTGWVEVSRGKVATGQRVYRRDELEPLERQS